MWREHVNVEACTRHNKQRAAEYDERLCMYVANKHAACHEARVSAVPALISEKPPQICPANNASLSLIALEIIKNLCNLCGRWQIFFPFFIFPPRTIYHYTRRIALKITKRQFFSFDYSSKFKFIPTIFIFHFILSLKMIFILFFIESIKFWMVRDWRWISVVVKNTRKIHLKIMFGWVNFVFVIIEVVWISKVPTLISITTILRYEDENRSIFFLYKIICRRWT